MMLMDLKELPEQKRVIVRSALQRINDISNSLLEKSKGGSDSSQKICALEATSVSVAEMKEKNVSPHRSLKNLGNVV